MTVGGVGLARVGRVFEAGRQPDPVGGDPVQPSGERQLRGPAGQLGLDLRPHLLVAHGPGRQDRVDDQWTRTAVVRDPQGAELTLSQFAPVGW